MNNEFIYPNHHINKKIQHNYISYDRELYMFSILGGLGLGVGAWYYIYKFVQKCVFIFFYLDPIFKKKVWKTTLKNVALCNAHLRFFFPAQREITLINGKWFWPTYYVLEGKNKFSLQKDVDQYMTLSFLKWKSQATFVPDQTYFLVWHFKYGLEIYSVWYKFNLEVKFINKWFWKIRKNTLERKDICNLWVMSLWVQS